MRKQVKWTDAWKEELVTKWPLDGPSPNINSSLVATFAAGKGLTRKAVVSQWYNMKVREENPDYKAKTRATRRKVTLANGHKPWTTAERDRLFEVLPPSDPWPGAGHWKVLMLSEEFGRTPRAIEQRWFLPCVPDEGNGNGELLGELRFVRDYLESVLESHTRG